MFFALFAIAYVFMPCILVKKSKILFYVKQNV